MVKIFFRKPSYIIERSKIRFEVHLNEGLDLSLFLFGNFQSHVSKNSFLKLSENPVIFDVGANFGIMTLQFAKNFPKSKVFSFEPTHYALKKFKRNIELNENLSPQIVVNQCFVSEKSSEKSLLTAYSSWDISGKKFENTHPLHGGTIQNTEEVPSISLDDFFVSQHLEKVDFIKIDTDGYEINVLRGARKILEIHKPLIIFEMGLYILQEKNLTFKDFSDFFESLEYFLFDSKTGKNISLNNFQKFIPEKGTIDVLTVHKSKQNQIFVAK